MQISKQQPMRPAEIELIDAINSGSLVEDGSITEAKIADGSITEAKIATHAVAYSQLANASVAEEKLANTSVTTAKIKDNAVTTTKIAQNAITSDRLSSDIRSQLTFLESVPSLVFGTSNSVTVSANSYTTVDVTFAQQTEVPVVFTSLQCATASVDLTAHVQSVTNTQASIVVHNAGSTDVSDVTVDYLAIAGR